jgi:repressor LexA
LCIKYVNFSSTKHTSELNKVTQKQQAVLDFVQRFIAEHHQAPFIREIQLGCQIASYKSTVDRLNALERKGLLRRVPNKHRGIKLARRPVDRPMAEDSALAQAGEVVI